MQKSGTATTTASSFTNFLKSKWRSSTKDTRHYKHVPTDIERDWVRHNALKLAFESDFKAPMHRLLQAGGCEVLDVGCGAGFWSLDMATKYRLSYFTGIDVDKNILPVNPKPKNVLFQRIDVMELPLPYEDDTFDYVFIRSMVDTVPDEEWDAVLREFVRIMKKGAFIECVEAYENLFDAGPAMSTILRLANSSSPSPPNSPTTGVPSGTIQNPLPNRMAAIGHLMGMQIRHTHTPVGLYGGAVGSSLLEYWERIIQSSRQKWIQDKLIGEKELEEVVNELRGEVEEYKTYMSWYSVVAQKKGYKGPVIRFEDVDT